MNSLFTSIILTLGFGALLVNGLTWAISSDKKTEEVRAKALSSQCKLVSRTVIASPTLSREPLSLYLCKDGDVEYHYVTNQEIK